jgi:hypothetical protein
MKSTERAEAIRKVKDRAEQERLEFFHDPLRHGYATVPVLDHRETWPIRSRDFRLWVMQTLYDAIGAAPAVLVKECIEEFETRAICRGANQPIFVRVCEADGSFYVDLTNESWQVVEVREDGWNVVDDSPVKFRRASGMLSLPYPSEGKLRDLLKFLNLRSRADEVLLLTWLAFALRPKGPYPVLSLSGVKGSAKSTTAKILGKLIDPSQAELVTQPRSERDLAIAATNSHLIAIDNLSEVSAQLSDSLCRLSTGGSFRTRRLYSDNEELLFTFVSPIILTGIGDIPTRSDLLDRCLLIHLERLETYRDEDLLSEFEQERPRIFGGLLDVLCTGLKNAKKVDIPVLPRMAAFARFGVAVEAALGFEAGQFLAAYQLNIAKANDLGTEASPIFVPIRDLLEKRRRFRGTAVELLEQLTLCATDLAKRHPHWPKAPNLLSGEIARIEPNLAGAGISVERGRTRRGRFIVLELRESRAREGCSDDSESSSSQDKSAFVSAVGAG